MVLPVEANAVYALLIANVRAVVNAPHIFGKDIEGYVLAPFHFNIVSKDTHSNSYDSLFIDGSNVVKGEVWYNEVGISVGYRFPLVKDIKAFYEKPYFHPWDMYVSVQPGVSIATVKNMEVLPSYAALGLGGYEMQNVDHVVPTLRFSAGVEWFIFSNFAIFAEASYTQHLMPTIVERAAMDQGRISHSSGPITISLGLSLFFN